MAEPRKNREILNFCILKKLGGLFDALGALYIEIIFHKIARGIHWPNPSSAPSKVDPLSWGKIAKIQKANFRLWGRGWPVPSYAKRVLPE
ncbi:unannotated protein [freshwater metagenome]|uniref:Unannotated protein n=1 Tax=freshwater metagenome TaxID=449393 RepID=A0A6J7N7T3_9ZZZZ